MPCDNNTLQIVDDLLEGKPLEYTINRRLSETRGALGRFTTRTRKIVRGTGEALSGMTGKFLIAVATGVGVWIVNSLIQKWLTSAKVKGKHAKIIQDSYEPMLRDVLKALQPALAKATQQVAQGQAVDANRIVAKERAKITRVIDAHFMEMMKKLRADIHQAVISDVSIQLDEALTNQIPQALNDPNMYGGMQTPSVHF